MTTIGIIGSGHVGSSLATAALAHGYAVVIANAQGPASLASLVRELGKVVLVTTNYFPPTRRPGGRPRHRDHQGARRLPGPAASSDER
jgi:hypothetical protein